MSELSKFVQRELQSVSRKQAREILRDVTRELAAECGQSIPPTAEEIAAIRQAETHRQGKSQAGRNIRVIR
jgi:hypothetical protein